MLEKRYWYKKGKELLDEIRGTEACDNQLLAWYIGQSGFIFKKGKTIVYIDPVLSDLTDDRGNTRRYYDPPFSPQEVQADYVICTHAHADHMAIPTLTGIAEADKRIVFIVPGDCIPYMTEAGIPGERIIEAKADTEIKLTGMGAVPPLSAPDHAIRSVTDFNINRQKACLTIHPLSAAHPFHQKTAAGGDVALSYFLDFNGIRVLHTGDTYLTDSLYHDLIKLPSPHLFLTPVNGCDYFRTARNCIGNLNSREAARLSVDLHADLTIPLHYDMVYGNTVDPLDFVRELRSLEASEKISRKWKLPELGEMTVIFR